MRVLIINEVCGIGSTGKICEQIAMEYDAQGHTVRIAYGRDGHVPESARRYAVRIGDDRSVRRHALRTRLLDDTGFASTHATRDFLTWVELYQPDMVWMHNLHGYYINVELLFTWLKKHPEIEKKWTLHDCWSFTGHCSHFAMVKCEQWKNGCEKCCQLHAYPKTYYPWHVKRNYFRKKRCFTGVENLTLYTPSEWMAKFIRQSFLEEYTVIVEHNSVNTDIFRPTESDFRSKYHLEGRKVILGVSSVWNKQKGLDDFITLAGMLDDNYAVVLVGVTHKLQKSLPKNVIGIEHTSSPRELAGIYSMADVYVNPSREESFSLTTLEAICCGTEAIVYEDTACAEVVRTYGGGCIVEQSVQAIFEELKEII